MTVFKKYLGAALVLLAFNANAVVLSAVDQGWYNENGYHDPAIDNYIVGVCFVCGNRDYTNFFVFDLSDVETVRSATLRVFSGQIFTNGTYSMWDVQTDIATLVAGGFGLLGIYDDLGIGESFGSVDLDVSQSGQFIDINLNSTAIDAINSQQGLWAIGGSYLSDHFGAFGDTQGNVVELILQPVPLPEALMLFVSGLLGLRVLKRSHTA